MIAGEAVIIGRLQIPPEAMTSCWPEHEVSGQLSSEGVGRFSVLFQVSPLRSHTEHELSLSGECPWFFEEEICIPFRCVPSVKGRHTRLKFKPVFDGGTLCRKVGGERCSAPVEVPVGACSYFQDGYG